MFPLDMLPPEFLDSAAAAAIKFGEKTSEAITDALACNGHLPSWRRDTLRSTQAWFVNVWMERMQMQPLRDRSLYLVSGVSAGAAAGRPAVADSRGPGGHWLVAGIAA